MAKIDELKWLHYNTELSYKINTGIYINELNEKLKLLLLLLSKLPGIWN